MQIDLIANAKNQISYSTFSTDKHGFLMLVCSFVDSRKKQGKLDFRQKKDNGI